MSKHYTPNFREQTGSSVGVEPLVCLEITHPQLSTPIRVVNDNVDLVQEGDPSLAFDFTQASSLSLAALIGSGTIIVTRAADTATRVNASGLIELVPANTPRYDYDPISRQLKGLLIEETSTNLLLRSEDFSVAPWDFSGSGATVVVNQTAAPSGTVTADKLSETAVTLQMYVGQLLAKAASTIQYTLSVYLKQAERSWGFLTVWSQTSGNGSRAFFNLATGAKGSFVDLGVPFTGLSSTIEPAANGFYRCTFTFTADATTTLTTFVSAGLGDGLDAPYAGTAGYGIYMWGSQLIQPSAAAIGPTSYIPTAGTAVTRNNDDLDVTSLGSWFNNVEGTIAVEWLPGINPWYVIAEFNDGTTNQRYGVYRNGSNSRIQGYNVAPSIDFDSGPTVDVSPGLIGRAVVSFKTNDCAISVTGSASTTDTTVSLGIVNRLYLGRSANSGTGSYYHLNGHLRKFAYYPRKLSGSNTVNISRDGLTPPFAGKVAKTFTAFTFSVSLPDDMSKNMPSAPLVIDNIGKEMTQWLEQSNGGKGALVRIMQIMRDTPNVIEQEYTLDLLSVNQGQLTVTGQLGFLNTLDQICLVAAFTPETAPGLF